MPLGFGRSKSEDVVSLIAARKYSQAIEILRAQLKTRGASTTVRKQLADVLVLSGKTVEAVSLLLPLADKFAREGFAAKAISVLKRIQKIDPGRRDVEERLARLIEEKQKEAAVALPVAAPDGAIGMEEIGMDGPSLEIGFDSGPISAPTGTPEPEPPPPSKAPQPEPVVPAPPPEPMPEPSPPEPTPPPAPEVVTPEPEAPVLDFQTTGSPTLDQSSPDATLPLADLAQPDPSEDGILDLGAEPVEDRAAREDEIEDYDLLYVPEGEEDEEAAQEEETILPTAPAGNDVMSEAGFADELMSLVDSVFDAPTGAPAPAAASPTDEGQRAGEQIVVSPLFRNFSVDEMVAVIHGLKLLTFERGDVILREGQPGNSLYTLSSGRVRAFKKNKETGKQVQIGDLTEGAFFGEMSILTGQPRAASIVALNSCELLELDRGTLDDITKSHPHVWDVLREFAEKRSQARG